MGYYSNVRAKLCTNGTVIHTHKQANALTQKHAHRNAPPSPTVQYLIANYPLGHPSLTDTYHPRCPMLQCY